jgi:hypothetical protein
MEVNLEELRKIIYKKRRKSRNWKFYKELLDIIDNYGRSIN